MIYQLARDCAAALVAQKFPVTVYCGPERVRREGPDSHVVIFSRDTERGDSIEPPRGARRNARYVRRREMGVVVRVYARSNAAGARQHEHERECDLLVDGVIVALTELFASGHRAPFAPTEARYLSAEEAREAEIAASVVYQMRFTLPRAVERTTYAGEALPEGGLSSYAGSTRVTLDGSGFENV